MKAADVIDLLTSAVQLAVKVHEMAAEAQVVLNSDVEQDVRSALDALSSANDQLRVRVLAKLEAAAG